MIAGLKGIVAEIAGTIVVLDVAGVGYEVVATEGLRKRLTVGEAGNCVIYTDVKEDMIRLFGFADKLERQVFSLLTRVSGVGAKTAHDILSKIDKVELLRRLAQGDPRKLQEVKGIGKKTAERLVLELKDKVQEYALEARITTEVTAASGGGSWSDALEALVALGFPKKEGELALAKARSQCGVGDGAIEVGEVIRRALQFV